MNPRNPSNKRLWCFVIGFLLLVILLPVILAMLPVWDGPPVDDSDMQFVHREIPDEQNAFELFRKAEAAMAPRPDLKVWNQWNDDPQAHADEIRAWVDSNHEALRLLAEGVALGDYQTPERKHYTDGFTWLNPSLEMVRLLGLASRIKLDPVERMDLNLLQLRLAERNFRAGSSFIEAMGGIAAYSSAFGALFDTLQYAEMDMANLRRFHEALGDLQMDKERMVRVFQTEYHFFVLYMQEVRLGTSWHDMLLDYDFLDAPYMRPFTRPGTWGYQEENTKRLYLEYYRQPIAYLRGEIPYDRLEASFSEIDKLIDRSTPIYRKTHNMAGKLLVAAQWRPEPLVSKYKENRADLHALQLMTALHVFHRENGNLPDTLDALVPDYLAEVPADPFDGQPFRYLPAEARIYSIGKNREDNGGSIRARAYNRNATSRNESPDRVYGVLEGI